MTATTHITPDQLADYLLKVGPTADQLADYILKPDDYKTIPNDYKSILKNNILKTCKIFVSAPGNLDA